MLMYRINTVLTPLHKQVPKNSALFVLCHHRSSLAVVNARGSGSLSEGKAETLHARLFLIDTFTKNSTRSQSFHSM